MSHYTLQPILGDETSKRKTMVDFVKILGLPEEIRNEEDGNNPHLRDWTFLGVRSVYTTSPGEEVSWWATFPEGPIKAAAKVYDSVQDAIHYSLMTRIQQAESSIGLKEGDMLHLIWKGCVYGFEITSFVEVPLIEVHAPIPISLMPGRELVINSTRPKSDCAAQFGFFPHVDGWYHVDDSIFLVFLESPKRLKVYEWNRTDPMHLWSALLTLPCFIEGQRIRQ